MLATAGFSLILLLINGVAIALALFALIDAVLRSGPAFNAVGRGGKSLWLAILAGALAVAVLGAGILSLFGIAGLVAALVYLVDLRPKLRLLPGGRRRPGSWWG